MDILRLVTIHPILVHATLGGIPLMLLAYVLAARRRSTNWLFAGDFVLMATALITIATGLFGFIAFFVIDWPGGLDLWRWLHLGFGVATSAVLWIMAIARAMARRRNRAPSYRGLVVGASTAFLLSILAGWVGGEVLVYRSGVAVSGAQDGALAPPVAQARREPADVEDAMGRIRGHFASAIGEQFEMIVQRPTKERFAIVEREARGLEGLAGWLATVADRAEATHGHEHGEPQQPAVHEPPGDEAMKAEDHDRARGHDHSQHSHGETAMPAEQPMKPAEEDRSMLGLSRALGTAAAELGVAAREQDLTRIAGALDRVEATCVGCHLQHRWRDQEELRAER